MTLVKGFLQSRLVRKIPTYRYVVGITVGLLMAFFLYALQYMAREGVRWTSISETDLWLFNETEVDFYNLIFAFIAVIVGQSFFIEYIFNTSKGNFKVRSGRLKTIVNDQRLFNWYFLTWFSKMAMMYGLLFATAGLGGFYLMSFYPDYRFMFVLMIIVLFFQPWNGLLLTFKKRTFKWMGISLLAVSLLSFGLSKIQIINYEVLNQKVLNKRLDMRYNLRIPISKIYSTSSYRFNNIPNISIAMLRDSSKIEPQLYVGQKKISKGELPQEVLQIRDKQYNEIHQYIPVFLCIDEEVPMSYIHEIKRELTLVNQQNFNYVVIPSDAEYDEKYYVRSNRTFLSQYNTDYFAPDYSFYFKKVNTVSNRIEVSISNQGYAINEVDFDLMELPGVISAQIRNNLDYAIVLNFKENVNFQTYFNIIAIINEVVYTLRKKEALDQYGLDYKDLEVNGLYGITDQMRNLRKAIVSKYPMRYVENWDESGVRLQKKPQPDFALPE